MTEWREARADLAAWAKASVIVRGRENDLMAAADNYALALAEEMDGPRSRIEAPSLHESKQGRNGVWCCAWHALKAQVEEET